MLHKQEEILQETENKLKNIKLQITVKALSGLGNAALDSAKKVANGVKILANDVVDTSSKIAGQAAEEFKRILKEAAKAEIKEPKLEVTKLTIIVDENGKIDLPKEVKLVKASKIPEKERTVGINGSLSVDIKDNGFQDKLEGGLKFFSDGRYEFNNSDGRYTPGKYVAETAGGQKIDITVKLKPKESPKAKVLLGDPINDFPGAKYKVGASGVLP